MMMTVISSKKAQRANSPLDHRNHRKQKAYVARLKKGLRDTVDREFVTRSKSNRVSEIVFSIETQPGDIYEIRRWWWDASREAFMGGTVYVGFNDEGPMLLTRDEAFTSVLAISVEGERADTSHPVVIRTERILPPGIFFS